MPFHIYWPLEMARACVRPVRRGLAGWRRRRTMPMVVSQIARRPGTRIQIFTAHPDDVVWCAGLALALREAGAELALACLTRGEGGVCGRFPRDRLGSARERELRECAAALGIERITFLGYIDPQPHAGRPRAPQHVSRKLTADVLDQIGRFNPDVIVTHGSSGEGWQPAHVLMHRHVRKALRSMSKMQRQPPKLVTMNAWNPEHPLPEFLNPDDAGHLVVHSDKFAAERLAALRCHASQASLFEEMLNRPLEDFVAATTEESYRLW